MKRNHDGPDGRREYSGASALSSEQHFERTVEQAVVAAVLRAADPSRRQFLTGMGAAALSALIA